MKPWMSDKEIKIHERELLGLNKSHIDVLEWGCGGSTIYFTNFLKDNNISYTWVSIEHNRKWADEIIENVSSRNVDLHLFEYDASRLNRKNICMQDYVDFPLSLNRKFDVILIDGRKRKRCLIHATKLLNDSGVVLLHDALRSFYHGAFKYYPYSRFLSVAIWKGTIKKVGLLTRVANKMNYYLYRGIIKRLFRLGAFER